MQHSSNKSAYEDSSPMTIPLKQEFISRQQYTPSPCLKKGEQPLSCEGLVEYLSRPARKKIVEFLSRALLESRSKNGVVGIGQRRRGRPHSSGATLLANRLGISRKSVDRWLSGEMQSSNPNAVKIVDLAMKYVLGDLEGVLWEDVERHISEVRALLIGHGGGA